MPELPEVEVTRLSFADRIAGARIEAVRLGKPLRWPLGVRPDSLVGRTVRGVRRRGKYLLVDLDPACCCCTWACRAACASTARCRKRRCTTTSTWSPSRRVAPERPAPLRRRGVRRREAAPEAVKLLGGLGVEPWARTSTIDAFHAGLKRRKAPIKQVLLAGDLVVGVGNIYASEALFLAGIRPTLSAAKISRPRAARLHASIREVLARALEKGGSTLRDFSNAFGESGYFQLEAMVYDRAGRAVSRLRHTHKDDKTGAESDVFLPALPEKLSSGKGADAIVKVDQEGSFGYILQRPVRPAWRMAA
jgi:formamidopyrimidine-DNA glycosylase